MSASELDSLTNSVDVTSVIRLFLSLSLQSPAQRDPCLLVRQGGGPVQLVQGMQVNSDKNIKCKKMGET